MAKESPERAPQQSQAKTKALDWCSLEVVLGEFISITPSKQQLQQQPNQSYDHVKVIKNFLIHHAY